MIHARSELPRTSDLLLQVKVRFEAGIELLCFKLARLAHGDRLARFSVNDKGCQKINKGKREQVQINCEHK